MSFEKYFEDYNNIPYNCVHKSMQEMYYEFRELIKATFISYIESLAEEHGVPIFACNSRNKIVCKITGSDDNELIEQFEEDWYKNIRYYRNTMIFRTIYLSICNDNKIHKVFTSHKYFPLNKNNENTMYISVHENDEKINIVISKESDGSKQEVLRFSIFYLVNRYKKVNPDTPVMITSGSNRIMVLISDVPTFDLLFPVVEDYALLNNIMKNIREFISNGGADVLEEDDGIDD